MVEQSNSVSTRSLASTRRSADVMMLGLRSVNGGQGGIERHVERLSRELDAMGIAIDVIVRRPYQSKGETLGRDIRVVPLWSPRHIALETVVHSLIGVAYAIAKRPAVLHVHGIGPGIVIPLARLFGLAVVATHHGEDYRREKWGPLARALLRFGEWCQGHFANQRVCVSETLSQRLSLRFDRPFMYVPNGAELAPPVTGVATLERFGLAPYRYVLNVSRLVPEKRHLDLIAAFARLERTDLKLVLVGAADHEGAYSSSVRAAASKVPGVVIAGFQHGSQLAELFANSALFVLPSTHEGLPIALLEAMSYGRPVLVSNIEANLDVGLSLECYYHVADVEDLRRRMTTLLAEGRTSVDWTEKLRIFDWSQIARQTSSVYRATLRGSRDRR